MWWNNKLFKLIGQIDPNVAWKTFCDYFWIAVALAMYTVAYSVFLLPYKIVSGGMTGLATIVYYAVDIPVANTYLLINLALLGVALWILGWRFLTKTIYAIAMLTMMLHYGEKLVTRADGSLIMVLGEGQEFMAVVVGCAIAGLGLALVFLRNGSTGGSDIVAAILNKYKNFSMGQGIIAIDFFIISSSLFVPQFGDMVHRVQIVVFGLMSMFVETVVLDLIMNRRRSSVQFLIFSDKYQEIANAIGVKLEHGVTILDGHGWYTGKQRKVLCILAHNTESREIFRLIKEIDPNAFVSQSRVIGVYGEGFDAIRH
ncbi:MAG: YitT family protein [Prevotella sp.]|nr:YitT family protein [Prevotella sp.]MCF0208481.1 YitT family protein [Bacteroidaceae bacterium]